MRLIRVAGALSLLACVPIPAAAQPFERAGIRAQGMGGAFVAVADDASAVWWNPAGLADGPFFNALLEHEQQPQPGSRVDSVALATPPIGFSYLRVRDVISAGAAAASNRESVSGESRVSTLVAHEAGLTLLHSLTSGFVVGSTVKFVHATVQGRGTNRLDLDLGAHSRLGAVRVGFVVRHVARPTFRSPDGTEWTRRREARAGIAWTAVEGTTLAADLDLTDIVGPFPGRRVALGAERRFGTRLALRGGLRLRTSDGPDPWVSLGGSYAVRSGVWLDGFWGRSPDQDARWGVGARLAY